MEDIVNKIIGKSPLEVCRLGLATVANQLICEGAIHIRGSQIVPGPSKTSPPLMVSPCTDDEALAQYLSLE